MKSVDCAENYAYRAGKKLGWLGDLKTCLRLAEGSDLPYSSPAGQSMRKHET